MGKGYLPYRVSGTSSNGEKSVLAAPWTYRWLARAGLVLVGLLLSLILQEVALRVAASLLGRRTTVTADASGRLTILCLGDSHTYGVFYTAEESYPGQLQSILDRRAPRRYRVLNLGLPGMNSSEIATRFRGWLDRYQPYAVIFAAGVNNAWNRSDTEQTRHAGALKQWFLGLRLFRAYELLATHFREPPPLPEGTGRPDIRRVLKEGGRAGAEHWNAKTNELLIEHQGNVYERVPVVDAIAILRRDLEAMRSLASDHGVKMILLTYSAFPVPGRWEHYTYHEHVNEEMRDFSRQRRVTLVDVRSRFEQLLSGGTPRHNFFFNETDDHPNPRGYAEIAALVADLFEPPSEIRGPPADSARQGSSPPAHIDRPSPPPWWNLFSPAGRRAPYNVSPRGGRRSGEKPYDDAL